MANPNKVIESPTVHLNEELVLLMNVKPDCVSRIRELHETLDNIIKHPLQYGTHEDVVDLIEGHEYALQALWNFNIDSGYHQWWFKVDGCRCPKLDNQDRVGSPYRVINATCPFHGAESK